MIELARRDGRPLRIGHRGAAALAPENTLRSFRAAVAEGVDLVEFDVYALAGGELVVAHSDDLHEVSHGAHEGKVGGHSLSSLIELCPELLTLEEALEFFVDEAPEVGAHLDLKVRGREQDVVDAIRKLGLRERTLLSSLDVRSLRSLARLDPGVRAGITLPRSVLGITDEGRGATIARVGLTALRPLMPLLVGPVLALARSRALVLHHSAVSDAAVRRAHARGVPVVTWTVDDPHELRRVDEAGVDAVVTNDPTMFVSTLGT